MGSIGFIWVYPTGNISAQYGAEIKKANRSRGWL
jgi:hypothetical protein